MGGTVTHHNVCTPPEDFDQRKEAHRLHESAVRSPTTVIEGHPRSNDSLRGHHITSERKEAKATRDRGETVDGRKSTGEEECLETSQSV